MIHNDESSIHLVDDSEPKFVFPKKRFRDAPSA
jgi:hypothetical protein